MNAAFEAASQRVRQEAAEQQQGRIEDYLFIRGDQLTAKQAAQRLGVSARTIQRYRRILGTSNKYMARHGRRGACARWHGAGCRCWQTGAAA
jgi:DNA-binding CsgD family transcriptional regulator